MIAASEFEDPPFDNLRSWHGAYVSLDGTPAGRFELEEVAEVVAHHCTQRDDWDGRETAIVRLHDGRFVGWESWWGPTGSGFHEDAYGGDADIMFGATVEIVRSHLTERAREDLDGAK